MGRLSESYLIAWPRLLSAVGTNANCSDVPYLIAIRGKADVADIAFL